MRKALLGELMVHSNRHNSPMLVEGENRGHFVALGFITPGSAPRHVLGKVMTNEDTFLFGPGVEHLAEVMPGQKAFQIFIPAEMLAEEIAACLNRDPIDFAGRRWLLRLGRPGVHELIEIVKDAFHVAEDMITSTPTPQALEQIQRSLVERTVNRLTATDDDWFLESRSFLSTGEILLRARAFVEENANSSSIRLSDLCRAAGVGKRSLQLAFAEGLGLSPMQYLKLHRLSRVRERLMTTTPDELLVKQAARKTGFAHMGKFALDYKWLFGELPSETRQA
jgi:AraC-like DNA-binding protein